MRSGIVKLGFAPNFETGVKSFGVKNFAKQLCGPNSCIRDTDGTSQRRALADRLGYAFAASSFRRRFGDEHEHFGEHLRLVARTPTREAP